MERVVPMYKFGVLLLIAILGCAGCGKGAENAGSVTGGNLSPSTATTAAQTAPSSASPETAPASSPSPAAVSSLDTSELQAIDEDLVRSFLESIREPDEEIVVTVQDDLDGDGRPEALAALGYPDEEDPFLTSLTQVYVLKQSGREIVIVGENMAGTSYGVNEAKLVELEGSPKKYVYMGLTNGASMSGFQMFELSGGKLSMLEYSASAAGAGSDELTDADGNGRFDGFRQNRNSYDTLFYEISIEYRWTGDQFEPVASAVELPAYPEPIEDVILQYLSLRYLKTEWVAGKSAETDKRLSDLCSDPEAGRIDFSSQAVYDALYRQISETGDGLLFGIEEDGPAAVADVSFQGEGDGETYHYRFQLKNTGGKWRIAKITV